MDIEKLKAKIDERRRWNMEHLEQPNLVNCGLMQAKALIEFMERDDDAMPMGSSFMAYSRERIHEITNDPKNVILKNDDEIIRELEPMGYPGDIVDVVYPDGIEEICVEMSIANIMIDGFGKAMLENGTLTQEEYEEYLKDPWMEYEDNRIVDCGDNNAAQIVPLFRKDRDEQ